MTTTPPACTYPGCPDPHITRSGVMGCLLDGGDSDQPLVFASGTHLHVHDAEISRPSTRPRSERWSFTEGEATTTPPPEGTTEPRDTVESMAGVLGPDWTGGRSSVDFVRAQREPSPLAPAAEDDAALRRVRAAVRRAATWTEDGPEYEECALNDEAVDQVARAALDAAGVSALRAELAESERDWKQASESADRWFARAEAAEAEVERLRAERFEAQSTLAWLAPDRTQDGTLSHAVQVVRSTLDEARRQVADLRAVLDDERAARRIAGEAADRFRDVLADCLGHDDANPGDDVLVAEVRTRFGKTGPEPRRWRDFLTGARAQLDQIEAMPDPLRAALAGSGDVESPAPNVATSEGRDKAVATSGEQPGEGHEPDLSDGVPDDDGKALPAGLCYRCQRPAEAHRPAPVVPDSTDEDWWAIRAMAVDLAMDVEAIDAEWAEVSVQEQEKYRALGRLVRGVLAAVDQGVTAEQAWDEGYEAGWRKRLNRNPYRAAVRSGEQGGEGRG